MITIIDYGMGNLRSVQKALETLGFDAIITNDPKGIENATSLILPGVGSFGAAMNNLKKSGLSNPLIEYLKSGRPYLGICLGLQLLFEESSEEGYHKGLGVLPGQVVRFEFNGSKDRLTIPHMGWNSIKTNKKCSYLNDIKENTMFYFVHSYYVKPIDDKIIVSNTVYGFEFASIIEYKNIFATQFHPEKSSQEGLKILKNFAMKNNGV